MGLSGGGRTLGLHSSGVGDEEGSVVSDEGLLEVERRGGVNVLGVVLIIKSKTKVSWLGIRLESGGSAYGDDGLSDGLSDGVDLGDLSSSLDLDSDVDLGELVLSDDEDRLVVLVSEERGLGERDRLSVQSDEASPGGGVGDSGRGLRRRSGVFKVISHGM